MTPLTAEAEDVPHGGRRAARALAAVLLVAARLRQRPTSPGPPPEGEEGEEGGAGQAAESGTGVHDPGPGAAGPDQARVARRGSGAASGAAPGVTAAETELLLRVSEVASELALRAVTECRTTVNGRPRKDR